MSKNVIIGIHESFNFLQETKRKKNGSERERRTRNFLWEMTCSCERMWNESRVKECEEVDGERWTASCGWMRKHFMKGLPCTRLSPTCTTSILLHITSQHLNVVMSNESELNASLNGQVQIDIVVKYRIKCRLMCRIGDIIKYLINFQPASFSEKFTVRKLDKFSTCNVNWFSMFDAINSSEHTHSSSQRTHQSVDEWLAKVCTSKRVTSSWTIDSRNYGVWNETILSTNRHHHRASCDLRAILQLVI